MNYTLVFDALDKPFQWWFPGAGLGIGLFCLVMGLVAPKLFSIKSPHERTTARWFGFITGGLGIMWAIVSFSVMYPPFQKCQYERGTSQVSVIEGTVEQFQPSADLRGYAPETFAVQGVAFSYKDSVVTCGFHQTAGNGGPIRAQLPVRISYLPERENIIVRLEVGQIQ